MFGLGAPEIIALGLLGVLLFGRRLPEMGRYIGKTVVEFKKGMKGLEDEIDTPSAHPEQVLEQPRPPQRVTATAPKFEDDAGAVSNPKP
jgi:sec-independent protein translocase protein TatA